MTHKIFHALLAVLFVPLVGLTAVICVAQAFCLAIVDKAYRKDLYGRVFGKPEH
jgi:hypothetical protein